MIPTLHALLVEDNPADARLLREVVAEGGTGRLRLSHEDRLSKALSRLEREQFDVVLLDLSLPDADGLDTLKRAHGHSPSVPIVVLTGLDDEGLALTAVREGAQDYLVKGTVDKNLLLRTIKYATERKRSIEALQRSEEYFRSLIENALDIITVMNPDGTLRYGSPSFERVLGYTPEELANVSMFNLVREADRETLKQMVRAALASPGTTQTLTFWFRHKNGSWRVLEAIGQSLIDNPEVSGIVINSRDITERTLTEQKLAKANETLRAVILASPLAICTLDHDNRVQSWNPAAEQMFGWQEEELLGQPLPIIPEEDQDSFRERLRLARQGQPLIGYEVLNRRKEGSHIEVSIWTAAMRVDSSDSDLVIAIADNTERKRLEEQFRQSQKMEAVGRLAGGVAHDFNNLLTVITGYCEMVISQLSENDPLREEMDQVLKAAERATGLTKQLLAFSRRQVVQAKVLDPNMLLKDMEIMLRRLIGEHVLLSMHLRPSLGRIKADAGQIEQVVVNLVVNARDAMPSGGKLVIETANVELDDSYAKQHLAINSGSYVMIAVSDNG
ncbi:MAG TPA: PAS domain S-box protein, partial [Chloroflexota bacterium]|nr:PAS domain S-box protein [Chloroflexota bacterium]